MSKTFHLNVKSSILTANKLWCIPCFRLKESSLNVTVEKASEIAKKTERELFHLYKDTDSKYKNKYRSLMFNLRDTKNNVGNALMWLNKNGIQMFTCLFIDVILILLFRCYLRKFWKERYLLASWFEWVRRSSPQRNWLLGDKERIDM